MGMEVVVGFLIAWAAGKARRVGKRVNGLTDHALDMAVDRIWAVVAVKLGADPAIQQLVAESRETGDASPSTRDRAEKVLKDTAELDPQFATELRAAAPKETSQNTPSVSNSGVLTGAITAGRSVTVSNKVVNYAKRNPVFTVIVIAVLALGIWFGGKVITGNTGSAQAGSAAIVGTWTASDGTGTKVFDASGRCEGFYYNNGALLDIGGPMRCAISSSPDAQNRYTLTVTQSPNKSIYKVQFDAADHAAVYSSTGQRLYELGRS